MKRRLITFSFILLTLGASAQTSREEARRVILGGGERTGSRTETPSSSDRSIFRPRTANSSNAQVNEINREYDRKIQSIRNNNTLSSAEKERTIRQLERDRDQKIRQVTNNGDRVRKDKNKNHKNGKYRNQKNKKGKKDRRDRDDD